MNLDYEAILSGLPTEIADHRHLLLDHLQQRPAHGDSARWDAALASLPELTATCCDFGSDAITIGRANQLNDPAKLRSTLRAFMPWRKGPWNYFGVEIDTEWRSNLKWQRIARHVAPLKGRRILDIGAGNGYYMLRALGEGAEYVLGIDPSLLVNYQFAVARHFVPNLSAELLPLRIQQLPSMAAFDTALSLGILYHRRDPSAHLREIFDMLKRGGEAVLETLVIAGTDERVLEPGERYAKMPNVWSIPTTKTLERWLMDAGFNNVRTVDVTPTTGNEQRQTDWMQFQSLADYLDPEDPTRTVEGYPAPIRATVLANRPG